MLFSIADFDFLWFYFIVHGKWSEWSNYTLCDKPCGKEVRTRTRFCNKPEPEFGGESCKGDDVEYQSCAERECKRKLFKSSLVR